MKKWAVLFTLASVFGFAGCVGDEVVFICGNGVVEGEEECDDGHRYQGDGCSSTCKIEPSKPDKPSTPDTPSTPTNCPAEGSSCTGESTMCCNNSVYLCEEGSWSVEDCSLDGFNCESLTIEDTIEDYVIAWCTESCDAKDDGFIVGYMEKCYNDKAFEVYTCEKADSGRYALFGKLYAKSLCSAVNTKVECNDNFEVVEVACSSCDYADDEEYDYVTMCK